MSGFLHRWAGIKCSLPHAGDPSLLTKDELVNLVHSVSFARANPRLREQLDQLHRTGPVWDGKPWVAGGCNAAAVRRPWRARQNRARAAEHGGSFPRPQWR